MALGEPGWPQGGHLQEAEAGRGGWLGSRTKLLCSEGLRWLAPRGPAALLSGGTTLFGVSHEVSWGSA